MSINSYQREIYSSHLEHAERRNHKYLYKIGDRYIYPEDVAGKAKSTANNIGSMATAAGTAAKTKISNAIADQKTKHKDRKFVKDSRKDPVDKLPKNHTREEFLNALDRRDANTAKAKEIDQITKSHKGSTNKFTSEAMWVRGTGDKDPAKGWTGMGESVQKQKAKTADRKRAVASEAQRKSAHAGYEADKKAFPDGGSTEELERQKRLTKARKMKSSNPKTEEQRKSAHAGYEADKKAFPEGGSTEELEEQKRKTKARKTVKRTQETIDKMRKRRKK